MVAYISLPTEGVEERWYVDEGIYRRYENESLVEEHPFDIDDQAWQIVINNLEVDSANLLARLRTALTTDQTYLDKVTAGTATPADHTAQVAALTRQMVAVMLRSVLYIR